MNEEELELFMSNLVRSMSVLPAQQDVTRVAGPTEPPLQGRDARAQIYGLERSLERTRFNVDFEEELREGQEARERAAEERRRERGYAYVDGNLSYVGPIDPMTEFIDSLQTSVGGDVGVTRGGETNPLISFARDKIRGQSYQPGGWANPLTEDVTIAQGEEESPRRILGHEFGHIAHFRDLFPAGEEAMREKFPSEPGLRGRVEEIGRVPWQERYATSFGEIFTSLSSTANDSDLTLDNFIEKYGVREYERPLLLDMLRSPLFRDHPLSHDAFSESIGRSESLKDMPQDVTKVDDPRTPKPEISRGDNIFRNIIEGLDPTLGLATSWMGLKPDEPSLPIQLAAGVLFAGGSLVKGGKAVADRIIKKLAQRGSITPATRTAVNNLPPVQRIPGIESTPGPRQIIGPAVRIDEDIILASPNRTFHQGANHTALIHDQGEAMMPILERIGGLYDNSKGVDLNKMFGFLDNKGNFLLGPEAAAISYDAGRLTRIQARRRSIGKLEFNALPAAERAGYVHRVIDGEGRFFTGLASEDLWESGVIARFTPGPIRLTSKP